MTKNQKPESPAPAPAREILEVEKSEWTFMIIHLPIISFIFSYWNINSQQFYSNNYNLSKLILVSKKSWLWMNKP